MSRDKGFLIPFLLRLDSVRADRQISDGVKTTLVARGRALGVVRDVDNLDRCVRNAGPICILHRARNATYDNLSECDLTSSDGEQQSTANLNGPQKRLSGFF